MELKDSFIQTMSEVMPIFKVKPHFKCEEEVEAQFLVSAEQMNVLNSFSHAFQGNIVFGFSRALALKIVSNVKGAAVPAIDDESQNTIGEIATLAVNVAMSKFKAINSIYISPPVFIGGENVISMISRVKTTKLFFQVEDDNDRISIAYYIEPGPG
jgi:CheY-specific phosphatase CheX